MLIFLLAHIAKYINELQRKNKKNMISKYDIFLLNLPIVRILSYNGHGMPCPYFNTKNLPSHHKKYEGRYIFHQ